MQAGGSGTTSLASDNTFEAAASEASTTAFAGFASSCTSQFAPTQGHTVAGLAAELRSGVSAELEPVSFSSSHQPAHVQQVHNHPSLRQPSQSSATFHPTIPETISSSHSESIKAAHMQSSLAEASELVQVSITRPDHTTDTSPAASCQARPVSSQPAALVCRRDMSSAALAVQASLAPSSSSDLITSAAASPPSTDAQEAQPAAKRQKRVFLHGNYNRYYGYRLGAELEEDPRVQVRVCPAFYH